MRTIGMLGGLSWESSSEYYRIINQEIRRRLGGLHSAKCILYSVDFNEIELCQRKGDWQRVGQILAEAARAIEAAGADFIIICSNTAHKVSNMIKDEISIPLLHIADITAKRVKDSKVQAVGLLGTKYTMEESFYKSRLEAEGIKVIVPKEEDRIIVNEVIFNELCLGRITDESRVKYKRIIGELIDQGATGIILGCTEIGLLIKADDCSVPLFDTALIHALGAVDFALS